jgi:hypothetical protein
VNLPESGNRGTVDGEVRLLIARQPPVGQGLLTVDASRSHSDTPQSVGLLRSRDQPDAETSTWQHTTLTKDRHPCPRRDSNPQPQQASGRRPTPYTARPLGSAGEVYLVGETPCSRTSALTVANTRTPLLIQRPYCNTATQLGGSEHNSVRQVTSKRLASNDGSYHHSTGGLLQKWQQQLTADGSSVSADTAGPFHKPLLLKAAKREMRYDQPVLDAARLHQVPCLTQLSLRYMCACVCVCACVRAFK